MSRSDNGVSSQERPGGGSVWRVLAFLLIAVVWASSCDRDEPRIELTPDQQQRVENHLLDESPDPDYELGVEFDDSVELVGIDVEGELVAGGEVEFTWYWRVLEDVEEDRRIFGHFESRRGGHRQHLDHYPLEDVMHEAYRTYHWRAGQIVEDVQRVRIDDDFPPGEAIPYVGLYRGRIRAPITNDAPATGDGRAVGPTLQVVNDSVPELPEHTVVRLAEDQVDELEIDGRLDESIWGDVRSIELRPFGGSAPESTAKVAYTEEGLVVGIHLADEHVWTTLHERDDDLWTEEVVELFLAPGGPEEPYVELQVNPLGTVFDARFAAPPGSSGDRTADIERARSWNLRGLDTAVHVEGTVNDAEDRDEFWSVEMMIPFEGLELEGAPPESGDRWRVNLYRFDRPDDDTTRSYGWSTRPRGDFHQIDAFGHWTFQ